MSYYLRLHWFIKSIKKHSIFYVKKKILINLQLNIQKKAKFGELIPNFEILHKCNLYVTIWMVFDRA